VIEWANPWAFALVPLVLALPAQAWLTGRNRLAVPHELPGGRRFSVRLTFARFPDGMRILGLLLCVIAFARPQITHRDVLVQSDGLDILLAVDTSGSMQAEDFSAGLMPVNRLEVAKGVMKDFIEERPYDRIGVVVFGEEAYTHVPLTLDHDTVVRVLDQVELGMAGPNATAIGSAIAVAARRIQQVEAPSRIIILLTDGRNNAGEPTPHKAAQMAAALGIRVYTIGVGAAATGFRQLTDGLDEPSLREIADLTGGQYFRATDTRSLQQIYARIDELEKSPAEVEEVVEHEELYRELLAPGFVLLLLQLVLSTTWLRRGP